MPGLVNSLGRTVAGIGRRTALAAALVAAALVAVLVVGDRISSRSYHRAALTEVARIQPANGLLTDMVTAQDAVMGYVVTLDPFRLMAYQESFGAFTKAISGSIKANQDVPSVQAQLRRLETLANQWHARVRRALPIASRGEPGRALRIVSGALAPYQLAHQHLMSQLQERRLDAVRDGDRWGAVVLIVSIAAVALGALALVLVARRRLGSGPLRA